MSEELDLAKQVEELRAANQRLQRSLSRAKERQADLVEAVYQAARDAAVSVGRAGVVARPGRDRRRSPEVALLHLTDWQVGKETESFNTEIAKQRVHTVVRKTVKLAEIQRADHPVPGCVIMLGGDTVENLGIFPGQAYEVDSTAFVQVFEAAGMVESVILTALEGFEWVVVYDVDGNHGRIGRRGDMPRGDNLDRVVYKIARERLKDQPRLTWKEETGWYRIVEIGNYRAMLVHGDQIKSFGGNVPAYGVLRKANAWQAGAIPESFQDLWLGHMHQPMQIQMANGGLVRMTPSIESGSAYAREFMGAHGKPGQRLCFVSPERGIITAEYLLEVEE